MYIMIFVYNVCHRRNCLNGSLSKKVTYFRSIVCDTLAFFLLIKFDLCITVSGGL